MTKKTIILTLILSAIATYLCFSFVLDEWNFRNWRMGERILLLIVTGLADGIYIDFLQSKIEKS